MIEPNVGPIGQLREQVAHTYRQTPQAYHDLRQTPIRAAPPEEDWENRVGGVFTGDEIYLNTGNGMRDPYVLPTLAHEQSHQRYQDRGYLAPSVGNPYLENMNRWRNEDYRPNGTIGGNTGRVATNDMWDDARWTGLYKDRAVFPDETYARSVELSPNTDRSDWPDYIRPYYKGYLQGMDTLSTGEDTPDVSNATPLAPDENGLYGTTAPYYSRPYRNWR